MFGDPGAIRTRDPQIRNLVLYPAELRGLNDLAYSTFGGVPPRLKGKPRLCTLSAHP